MKGPGGFGFSGFRGEDLKWGEGKDSGGVHNPHWSYDHYNI